MTLITAGMGVVLKHIKKSGKAITKAGDKWHAKTMKLQHSKKTSEKIKGAARIGVPMTVAVGAGAALGVHDAKKEIRKRGVYGVGRKDVGPKSIYKDIKKVIKKIKGK
jgi:hypothetical protein